MNIFAIETSCDETSASILRENKVLSNVISSQAFHSEFGGVVPELASRAQLEAIDLVASRAFEDSKVSASDIELVAATSGPGLIGSLLTGLNYAKAYALARDTKFIAVNHIEAHL